MSTFGMLLKEYRERAALSQNDLATQANLSASLLHQVTHSSETAADLADWGDAAYAERFRRRIATVRAAEAKIGDGTALTEADPEAPCWSWYAADQRVGW